MSVWLLLLLLARVHVAKGQLPGGFGFTTGTGQPGLSLPLPTLMPISTAAPPPPTPTESSVTGPPPSSVTPPGQAQRTLASWASAAGASPEPGVVWRNVRASARQLFLLLVPNFSLTPVSLFALSFAAAPPQQVRAATNAPDALRRRKRDSSRRTSCAGAYYEGESAYVFDKTGAL